MQTALMSIKVNDLQVERLFDFIPDNQMHSVQERERGFIDRFWPIRCRYDRILDGEDVTLKTAEVIGVRHQ